MDSEKDLLFPAFQKFYSALSSLERFRKGGNFFDNISCLDTFFAEFKGIIENTEFVLQNTHYKDLFKGKKEEIYEKFGWFHKTRDGVIHRFPFPLKKQIDITVYFPSGCVHVLGKSFTIDNDEEFSSLLDQLHAFFFELNPVEVLFSAKFSFYQGNSREDLFAKVLAGIREMLRFLTTLKEEIPERSPAGEELFDKIKKSYLFRIPIDMLLVDDFVYYPSTGKFENVERWGLSANFPSNGKTISRTSMQNWRYCYHELGENDFDRFVAMHVAMRTREDIMLAVMIIFQDDTYEIDAFNASNKTTLYRKIHETAQQVLEDNVREVFFEYSLLTIADVPGVLGMTSKDRQKFATEEWLVLLKIDNELNEEEYRFYVPGLECPGYIRQRFNAGSDKKLLLGKANMLPIIEAFKKKTAMHQNSVDSAQQ